jgi:hypothetical protein
LVSLVLYLSLLKEQRKFITVALGTIHPTAASIAAVSGPAIRLRHEQEQTQLFG